MKKRDRQERELKENATNFADSQELGDCDPGS